MIHNSDASRTPYLRPSEDDFRATLANETITDSVKGKHGKPTKKGSRVITPIRSGTHQRRVMACPRSHILLSPALLVLGREDCEDPR